MPLTVGSRLGPYEIVTPLGAGGMGEVYRARDTRLDRTVAIKILESEVARDPARRERFEREARAVSSLSHPHICALYDVGQHDDVEFLVMEDCQGETLADRLAKRPLRFDQVLQCAVEIAEALDAAHRHGIIHRDLKPANIMLTGTGAKLLDFGVAKWRKSLMSGTQPPTVVDSGRALTADGAIVGTLNYMAPEQLEGREVDARTDIFAFGTVLYEMATGRKAFDGQSQASVIAAILEREPPAMRSLEPLTPPALERTAGKCLAKDPDHRWQTAQDLADELRWIVQDGLQVDTRARVSERKGRKRIAWMTAGAFLLATVSILAVLFALSRRSPNEMRVVRFLVSPPDDATFAETAALMALSPDGRMLAFLASKDGKTQLWIRPLDSTTARPLAGTEGAGQPFWSPDGRYVAFSADGKLKKIDLLRGGPPQTISEGGMSGTWSADGVIVFAKRGAGLYRVSASGGVPTPVTTLDRAAGDSEHLWPHFLPDGRHLIYSVRSIQKNRAGVFLGSLDAQDHARLLESDSNALYAQPGYLLFRRQGALVVQPFDARRLHLLGEPSPIAEEVIYNAGTGKLVFSVSQTGELAYRVGENTQLVWFNRAGKRLASVGAMSKYTNPALSPDERRIAVARLDPQTGTEDIWIIDLVRGVESRFTFDAAWDTQPLWSPDGSRIVFNSNRRGNFEFYQKMSTGAGEEELLFTSPFRKSPLDWSRDGRFILFRTISATPSFDFWVLPLSGAQESVPFLRTEFTEQQGELSPNGRWLAYASDESGSIEVFVRSFPASETKWQISSGGGDEPRWRGDGKELFYLAPDRKLMGVQVTAGSTFQAGSPEVLFQTDAVSFVGGTILNRYRTTADGQRFLINTPIGGASSSPITAVVNWTAALHPR